MSKTDAENGYIYNGNNWAYNIKTILDQIGMSNIWLKSAQYNHRLQQD